MPVVYEFKEAYNKIVAISTAIINIKKFKSEYSLNNSFTLYKAESICKNVSHKNIVIIAKNIISIMNAFKIQEKDNKQVKLNCK